MNDYCSISTYFCTINNALLGVICMHIDIKYNTYYRYYIVDVIY